MKSKIKKFIICFVMALSVVSAADADVHVREYTKHNGTYVPSYHRSNPDETIWNNYSTKGNVNPWTGKPGYKNPTKW